MANNCFVRMAVRGTRENIEEFIQRLNANYNYTDGIFTHKPHFWGVLGIVDNQEDDFDEKTNTATNTIWLDCKWSVYSSLLGSDHSYYADGKKREEAGKENYGTCLEETSKELDLDIEIISEECGIGFMEHLRITKGDIVIDEVYNDYICMYIGNYDSFDEFKQYAPKSKLTEEEFNKLKANGNMDTIYRENGYEGDFVMLENLE